MIEIPIKIVVKRVGKNFLFLIINLAILGAIMPANKRFPPNKTDAGTIIITRTIANILTWFALLPVEVDISSPNETIVNLLANKNVKKIGIKMKNDNINKFFLLTNVKLDSIKVLTNKVPSSLLYIVNHSIEENITPRAIPMNIIDIPDIFILEKFITNNNKVIGNAANIINKNCLLINEKDMPTKEIIVAPILIDPIIPITPGEARGFLEIVWINKPEVEIAEITKIIANNFKNLFLIAIWAPLLIS